VPRRPLDTAITRARRERDRAAAIVAAKDAELAALLRAQNELISSLVEEHRLHPDVNNSKVVSEHMQADSRSIAISKGKSEKDAFMVKIRASGYTLRSLADAVDTPPSLLSMQRKGERPIPKARAEKIEELTGWSADKKHWPGGIS
jgi:hypothetical protein